MTLQIDAELDDFLASACSREFEYHANDNFTLTDDDIDLLVFQEPTSAIPSLEGLRLGLFYIDAKGTISERQVYARKVWFDNGIGYLTAHCLKRNAVRSFRIDRIAQLTDLVTGEIAEGAAQVLLFFEGFGATASDPAKLLFYADIQKGLRILAAVAWADGIVVDDELEACVRYADYRAGDLGILLDETEHEKIKKSAASLYPKLETARADIASIKSDPEHAKLIAKSIRSLIASDGRTTLAEMLFVKALLTQ